MDLTTFRRAGLFLLSGAALGCSKAAEVKRADSAAHKDSTYAAVQERGKHVMGVDQYTSKHLFEDQPDGGRVILDRDDATDSVAIAVIRSHMREILADFKDGNFSRPFHVHAMQVPGTDIMKANASLISYSVVNRPRGAELRIRTADSASLAAIRRFFAFQRKDHRAGEHDM